MAPHVDPAVTQRVLNAVTDTPSTAQEIATRAGLLVVRVYTPLRQLFQDGQVRVVCATGQPDRYRRAALAPAARKDVKA